MRTTLLVAALVLFLCLVARGVDGLAAAEQYAYSQLQNEVGDLEDIDDPCLPGNENVALCNSNGRITHLMLQDADISTLNTVPMTDFVRLIYLDVSDNELETSDLPTLPDSLQTLLLFKNDLQGVFPAVINSLPSLVTLDLSDNEISSPPSSPAWASTIVTLKLSDNDMSGAFDVSSMTNLKTLMVYDNELTDINFGGNTFPSLKKIDASDNSISSWTFTGTPSTQFPVLSTVVFSDNKLSAIKGKWSGATSIRTWKFSGNSLGTSIGSSKAFVNKFPRKAKKVYLNDQVPPMSINLKKVDATKWKKLKILDLSSNSIKALPNNLGKSPLLKLYVSDNEVSKIPASFGSVSVPQLRVLEIENNQLVAAQSSQLKNMKLNVLAVSDNPLLSSGSSPPQLPKWITKIKSLKELHAANIGAKKLPNSIDNLVNLKILDISRNVFKTELPTLPDVNELTVENCRMPEIWPSIYKLTGLKDLDLSGNKIAKISNKKIKKMKQLESVDLSSNKLTSIPSFGGLSQLKKLDVSRNDLTSLALGLKNLFLSDFDCSHNQLTATPDGLFASTTNLATTLRTLDISFNSIASLSPDIQKLPEIRDFDASNNLLTSLPTGFTTDLFDQLFECDLSDNSSPSVCVTLDKDDCCD